MKIKNELSIDVDAFVKIDQKKRRGAGSRLPDGSRKIKILSGQELKVDFSDGLPQKALILEIEKSVMPSRNGMDGVKLIAGTSMPVTHYFEFKRVANKYISAIHYNFEDSNEVEDLITHIDPQIKHPDT